MDGRRTPGGYQHAVELWLRRIPDAKFIDPLCALADLEAGMSQPIVEVVEQHTCGAVTARVSLFGVTNFPNPHEKAAIQGLVAELTYADSM